MDSREMDNTERAMLGATGNTFPSIRGSPYFFFSKGLYLRKPCIHQASRGRRGPRIVRGIFVSKDLFLKGTKLSTHMTRISAPKCHRVESFWFSRSRYKMRLKSIVSYSVFLPVPLIVSILIFHWTSTNCQEGRYTRATPAEWCTFLKDGRITRLERSTSTRSMWCGRPQ